MAKINRFSAGVTELADATDAGSGQDAGVLSAGPPVSQLAVCTMVWCGAIAVKGSDNAL